MFPIAADSEVDEVDEALEDDRERMAYVALLDRGGRMRSS